ncbi:Aspartic proteinase CDR1 [Sesamum alatum]|uniref:Aspartic proteinase CDR1 n=1 Tax=Sesamum alatum TaxID=300844 RepID=A0AAE1Y277_9LAMI|nr:Aspartic proteinase CDR1 [Sesamum alatum]
MAFYYKPLSLFFLFFATVFLIPLIQATKNGGITVDLIHRDSPLSPSYNSSHTHFERLRSAISRSFSRKSSLRLTSVSKSPESFQGTLTPIGGEYLMKVQIGTPPVEQLGIADTGSDLTWTQCKPCAQCYKQNIPLFDPRKTKTYRRVSCESDQCNAVGSASCDSSNACQYQVSYGDRSYSIGDLAVETFTFGSSSGQKVSFPKVVFGCGHENDGTFSATGSGIIGLGGGSLSIINQLDTSIGGKFSYCLTFLDSNVSSTISFGSDAIVAGRGVLSTPLVKKSPDTFYFLTLEGVSVGRQRLRHTTSTNTKASSSAEEGNIIIDSGTTLTFLPAELYQELESTLERAIAGKRATDPQGVFNLCYELPSDGQFKSPPIVAHFKGADLVLAEGSTFVEVEKGVVCLTLVPSEDLAIFGNLHQMNYKIGYDLVKQEVNFLPTDCSKAQ